QIYNIPGSSISTRTWEGGMGQYGQYCLDFFDTAAETAVRKPAGYAVRRVPRPGTFTFQGSLTSWEQSMRVAEFSADKERFSVPEGSLWTLVRPGEEDFHFAIPVRPVQSTQQFAFPVRLQQ
ncbi:hypothetical protein OF83DRAFT_1185016, partial [Amylostereum chailletii]